MQQPRVLVLFNRPALPAGHPDADSESDVLYSTQVVREFLANEGIESDEFGLGDDPDELLARLRDDRPEVVFNLFEGLADRLHTEAAAIGIMEWLDVPFTGCTTQSVVVARNKPLTKHLMVGAGLMTPEFFVVDGDQPCPANPHGWPMIVKPCGQDASVGIDQGAVVTNDRDLRDRVDLMLARYGGPVLVERFIAGREIHTTLVELLDGPEPTALPFSEILFGEGEKELWPIYSYHAKWDTESDEYDRTPVDVPVVLGDGLDERVVAAARRMYRLVGFRDYARVDARVTDDGRVYLLEANPNPSITSIMLRYGLEAIDWGHQEFVAHMARRAASRPRPPVYVPPVVPAVTTLVPIPVMADVPSPVE